MIRKDHVFKSHESRWSFKCRYNDFIHGRFMMNYLFDSKNIDVLCTANLQQLLFLFGRNNEDAAPSFFGYSLSRCFSLLLLGSGLLIRLRNM